MDFGIHIRPQGWMAEPANLIALARRAEALGYRFIGVADHVVLPRDVGSRYPYAEDGVWPGTPLGECFDVLGTLCYLAACTERIGLLSSVMVVPHRPAVLAARLLTTADVLSGGRVIAGVGVGWMREEFEALGAPAFADRGAVTDEYLSAFRALWSDDAPGFRGDHVGFDNIIFRPKPTRRHIPIWVGGESAPALRRTTRFGDAWYPVSNNQQIPLDTPPRLGRGIERLHRAAEQNQRDPGSIDIAYVWFKPINWSEQSAPLGGRLQFTGRSAQMVEDASALAGVGVRHLMVLVTAATFNETLERLHRFAEDVIAAVH